MMNALNAQSNYLGWLLQRRKTGMDCAKWRTICWQDVSKIELATQVVLLALQIDPKIEWRIVEAVPGPKRKLAWQGRWREL